jgi:hypothetical protein
MSTIMLYVPKTKHFLFQLILRTADFLLYVQLHTVVLHRNANFN